MKKKMLLLGLSFALVATLGGCDGDNLKPDGKAEGIPSSIFSEKMTLIADSMTLPDKVSKSVQQNDVRQSGEQSASVDEEETKGKVDTAGTSKSQDSQKEKGTMAKEQSSGQTKPKSTSSQNQPVIPEKNESGAGKSQASVPQKNSSQANLSQENTPQGNASQGSTSQGNVSQEGTSQGNVSGGLPEGNNWQQEPEPIVETTPNATAADSAQVASKVLEYINSYRSSPATSLSGLGGYARYRSRQLVSNFAHDTNAERAAATALCYGEYVDPSVYGMDGEPYYTACAREAIAKGGYVGTVDEVAESIAQLIKNSSGHWNYVGSSEYPYIGVGVTLVGMMLMSVIAAPNADIPKKMLENKFLNALAYTGYDVQAQKNDGSIFVQYSTNVTKPILSNITYGTEPSGLETVANGGTVTGRAPDIAYFEGNGLCCASYISYVYYNYLPNIEGVDTSSTPCPSNPRSAPAYYEQAQSWVAAGKARWISFTQGSNGSVQMAEEVPAGSLVVYKSASNGVISHVALYAGYYNGHHFVTHVGNSRGPEISTIENSYKNGTANILVAIIVPEFVEENGAIEVYKKDTDGNDLTGAFFVATNDDTGNQYLIGATNEKGYAITKEGIPYGTYTVRETVFPANYRSYGETEWKVTVNSSNNGVGTFHAVNEIIPGSVKIVKTSEDGVVDSISFAIRGNGVNKTVTTNNDGEVQIDDLKPGVYTVEEKNYDRYKSQEIHQVTVVTGQVTEVSFHNVLKRGSLQVIKSAEDGLVEGVKFHLFGTSLSGIMVDEYAFTNKDGVATFQNVLVSGTVPYTVEEVDTAIRYVVPESQKTPILWNEVTSRSFVNTLKKFAVTVTKRDVEKGSAQGNASLGGSIYGIYKGDTLVDQYMTDKNGQFTTKEYACGDDWTVREITPSEGYLLDGTSHKVGVKPELYTVEHNRASNDVTEQVIKGNIAIIKHTDNGETQIETPEKGATFEIYLKSSGSYEAAGEKERDIIICDENGFGQTKNMPYGIFYGRMSQKQRKLLWR